jgi:flavin reductase (DIM6/NTAB) family NADH-FMN oxidoreductase RutF
MWIALGAGDYIAVWAIIDALMVTPDKFRQVMGNFATGITVVTTLDKSGKPYGLTVNSFTSVSLDPVLVLVCLDNKLSGFQSFIDTKHFGVSMLCDAQEEISRMFAKKDSERPPDIYFEGQLGMPLLRNSMAIMECEIVARHLAGDHTIIVGRVEHADVLEAATPLLYFRGKYRQLNG